MRSTRKPNWQLPTGVSRATWDYIQSEHIATEYDEYFADSALMRLDIEIVRTCLPAIPASPNVSSEASASHPIPVIADLGCGTGRVARHLLPLGYEMINVDLSDAMLRQVVATTPVEYRQRSRCVCVNLVQLDLALEPNSVDLAVCLFSSIGMIRGRPNRRRFLSAVREVLKPGGRLLLHIHNRYRSWLDPGGPQWLLQSWLASWLRKDAEFGDRAYPYRRLPNMFLHIYSRRELIADLRAAGFRQVKIQPIAAAGDRLLPSKRPLVGIRAGGYFARCTK